MSEDDCVMDLDKPPDEPISDKSLDEIRLISNARIGEAYSEHLNRKLSIERSSSRSLNQTHESNLRTCFFYNKSTLPCVMNELCDVCKHLSKYPHADSAIRGQLISIKTWIMFRQEEMHGLNKSIMTEDDKFFIQIYKKHFWNYSAIDREIDNFIGRVVKGIYDVCAKRDPVTHEDIMYIMHLADKHYVSGWIQQRSKTYLKFW